MSPGKPGPVQNPPAAGQDPRIQARPACATRFDEPPSRCSPDRRGSKVTVHAQPLRLASNISAPDFQVSMLGNIFEITICAQNCQAMPDTDLGNERVNG